MIQFHSTTKRWLRILIAIATLLFILALWAPAVWETLPSRRTTRRTH